MNSGRLLAALGEFSTLELLYNVAFIKEVMRRRGVIANVATRVPAPVLDEIDMAEIEAALERLSPWLGLRALDHDELVSTSGPAFHGDTVADPRPTSDVPYHYDRAPGQKYLIVDRGVRSDTPVYIALRRVDRGAADQPIWLDLHAHNCNSFYLLIGDGSELRGIEGIVEIDGRQLTFQAPSAAVIPPFLLHRYWLTRGSGWYLQITLTPTYEESLIDEADPSVRTAPNLRDEDVLRAARPCQGGWSLIDETESQAAGIPVSVSDIERLAEAAELSPQEVLFDVICGSQGRSAEIVVNDASLRHTLATPVGVMSYGRVPAYTIRSGAAGVIRIRTARHMPQDMLTTERGGSKL